MIRTEREYAETLRRLDELRSVIQAQEAVLKERGLSPDDIELAMDHLHSFRAQIEDEANAYEHARARDFLPIHRLDQIGSLLIALRIGSGLTQRDLAMRLGVQESQVSRDEINEYHNVKVERAQNVLDVLLDELRMELIICVEPCFSEDAYFLGDEGFRPIADTSHRSALGRAPESAVRLEQSAAREARIFPVSARRMYGGEALLFAPPAHRSVGRAFAQGMLAGSARDAATVA